MTKKIEVDPTEYAALRALHDGPFQDVQTQLLTARANYDACTAVNREQLARLAKADTELNYLRERETKLEQELRVANARVRELEPATSSVQQPGRGSVNRTAPNGRVG